MALVNLQGWTLMQVERRATEKAYLRVRARRVSPAKQACQIRTTQPTRRVARAPTGLVEHPLALEYLQGWTLMQMERRAWPRRTAWALAQPRRLSPPVQARTVRPAQLGAGGTTRLLALVVSR